MLNYELASRQRRYTIGALGDWTAAAARSEARRLRQSIDRGEDPMAEIEAERAAPTVAELCDRFEQEHLPRKRPGTADDYRQMIANHIRPHFGRHSKVAGCPLRRRRGAAPEDHPQRVELMRPTVAWPCSARCLRWQCIGIGARPIRRRGIERNIEFRRRRYLKIRRACAPDPGADRPTPDQQTANIIRLLLLTGARKGEVLGDAMGRYRSGRRHLVETGKLDQAEARPRGAVVGAGAAAAEQIHKQQRPRGNYVFPSAGKTGHVVEIKKAWASI